MESKIWRDGCIPTEAAQGTGRREPEAETNVCGHQPGIQGAEGYS